MLLFNRDVEQGRRRGAIISAFCVFCFFLVVFFNLSGCGKKNPPASGDTPPKFTLPDLKGSEVAVPDDFIGRVVIIRFWEEGCRSCEKEMPMVDSLYTKYKERGLVVLAVNVGQPKAVAEAFAVRLGISYPVLLDMNSKTARRYGIKAVPFTLIVDRKGKIRKRILGETESKLIEAIVEDLL